MPHVSLDEGKKSICTEETSGKSSIVRFRFLLQQFISAVEYCHKHNVAHRDLKLDNTLLDNSDPPLIKICDFGFAKNFDADANMYTRIGTPVYMSPEVCLAPQETHCGN